MGTRTVDQLIAEVRELANIEGMTLKWTDAKVTRRLDQAYSLFRELISDHGMPYYMLQTALTCNVPASATTITGTADLTLPTDCVRVYYLDLLLDGDYYQLEPIEDSQRDLWYQPTLGRPRFYRLGWSGAAETDGDVNRGVRLFPRPDTAYTVHCWYLPGNPGISTGEDVEGIAGWEKWICYEAACQILQAEADTEQYQLAMVERQKIESLIVEKRSHRNRDAPPRITGARRGRMRWR